MGNQLVCLVLIHGNYYLLYVSICCYHFRPAKHILEYVEELSLTVNKYLKLI